MTGGNSAGYEEAAQSGWGESRLSFKPSRLKSAKGLEYICTNLHSQMVEVMIYRPSLRVLSRSRCAILKPGSRGGDSLFPVEHLEPMHSSSRKGMVYGTLLTSGSSC